MRHYEIVFLVHPDQSDQVPGMVERYQALIERDGGKVHRLEDWGRRQLSFLVGKVHKAHYVMMNVEINQATLDELAKDLPAACCVMWPGMLEGARKWGALREAEVFVLPSHQENFGIAVAEALAVGTPVLISRKVNIWAEIESEEAGFADTDDVAGTVRLHRRAR